MSRGWAKLRRFRRNFGRQAALLRRRLSLGIAGRLAVSFAAVAILAAAANLIAEHGVAIVHSTRLDRVPYSPNILPPTQQLGVAAEAVGQPDTRVESSARQHVDTTKAVAAIQQFVGAVDRYEHAVQLRARVEAPGETQAVETDGRDLKDAAQVLQVRDPSRDRALPASRETRFGITPKFGDQLALYLAAGSDLVQAADAERMARRAYALRIEAMDRRINLSLDRGWKIFGRVIARQSLVQLRADLEELRRRSAVLSSPDGYDKAKVDAAAAGETALAANLERNEAGFRRTEGGDWVQQLREDITQTGVLRENIISGDSLFKDAADKFAEARTNLISAVPSPKPLPGKDDSPPHAAGIGSTQSRTALVLPVQSAAISAASLPAIAAPIADTVTTTDIPDQRARRTLIGLITAGVLAVLFAVSVLTVRSIVVPVSRLLTATRKLAAGESNVRVPRGGIKELDNLAVAFNRMASQLAAAREVTHDYREHLETQVEQRTRQLQHLAEHDPLTLLPNRRRFFVLLNHALKWAAEHQRSVVVFFIDIDNFKNLNDSLGHAFGDRVLITVAQLLEHTAASFGFAARLGGDEFTVVYQDASSVQDAQEAGQRLVEAFHQALRVDGREVTVSVSVGASLYPNHELRAEDLLSAADAALFRAKALGRNQLAIFTPELLENATRKFTTEQGVRRALEYDEFELVFQPEVSLDSLELVTVEALLRWRLPDGRLASPAEFLAVTEESGLIIEVGSWVLRHAFATAARWHHGQWPDVRIAINVSPRQLLDQRFVEHVQELLREFRLPPQCIEFELTESVLQTGPSTIESLRILRSLNIAIALDDFGTGYSSLASLEQLPLTRIKLDRTLIASIDTSSRSAAIVAALIKLCEGLGLEITAEGVERPAQFRCLAGYGAMSLQGYLISRPVAADEILRLKDQMPLLLQDLWLSVPGPGVEAADDLKRLLSGRSGSVRP